METNLIGYLSRKVFFNSLVDTPLYEANLNEEHLQFELLDIEDFIKKNDVEQITDPLLFIRNGVPSPKGLLSNEIFGITKDDRSNIFGYIDLGGWFLQPIIYKIWTRMDSRIREIVHQTNTFSLDENGFIVEDPNGSTGVEFLKRNIDKIRIKETQSRKRQDNINFIYANKNIMFINKYIVIPAFYRDANTTSSSGAGGVGVLNKYYQSLIISTNSIKETQDYGFSIEGAISGRIQETILNIYNCLSGTSHNKDDGVGLSGKTGFIREGVMSKTADYGTRLVLSAPELKVESVDDMMVNADYAGLPLASALVNFHPFIIFHVKRFFENQFGGGVKQSYIDDDGKLKLGEVKDPLVQFSDELIEEEMKKFIYGYSARLEPVKVKMDNGKSLYMVFKGKNFKDEDVRTGNTIGQSPLINRKLTWCDIFYMAASEACRDKIILITRYPIDSYFNQFPSRCRITSLKQTEKVYVNNTYFPFYPKIRESDIGKNTSNMFIDTLMFSNIYLKSIIGDYDGDQASVKAAWTIESNEELMRIIESKSSFIDLGGINIKVSTNEAIQSLYSLTKILPQDQNKLVDPIF